MDQLAAATDFAQKARSFCAFVETAGSLPLAERLVRGRALLADLFDAGCRLPEDADGPEAPEVPGTAPADWPGFGELDIYSEVFDPYASEPPSAGSLSDDVCDIYQDLRRGLAALDAGNVGGALWDWRFHFQCHWGVHAASALRALHWACQRLGR